MDDLEIEPSRAAILAWMAAVLLPGPITFLYGSYLTSNALCASPIIGPTIWISCSVTAIGILLYFSFSKVIKLLLGPLTIAISWLAGRAGQAFAEYCATF